MDPFEYDKLGFGGRVKLFRFVTFVWGCHNAGYAGQSLKTAVAFIMRMPMILLGPTAHLTEISFLTPHLETELRKPASSASTLAEHSVILQEHFDCQDSKFTFLSKI